ncbi:hypothetical protein DYH09_27145 [bacterium CPR1]|nr:hypothetical protein [bacterium CPR1]
MKDLPSRKEVKKSGTRDWLDQAVREQERRNAGLADVWGDTPDELARKKQDLAGLLDPSNLPPEPEAEKAPDLFAKRGLASMFDDEQDAVAEEKRRLQSMFGPPSSGPPKKKR